MRQFEHVSLGNEIEHDYGSFTELLKVEEQWPSMLPTPVKLLCITNASSLV